MTEAAAATPVPVPVPSREADPDRPQRPLQPLLEPREGVPTPVHSPAGLAEAITRLRAGTGPVAVDAERASGYRYTSRAYLVQLRRAGSGTTLVDPVPLPGLAGLGEAIADAEWVIHAASQDLPCLAAEGMIARRLFDTELAGRLLGYPRVGLGAMVAEVLGYSLEKGHSAADWSTRPLPEPWLRYAALDVELLLELRDALEEQLRDAGKLAWAREEFAAIVATHSSPPDPDHDRRRNRDRWRRTSGLHRVRRPRSLAAVRALWQARDAIAAERDLAPGRVLPDAALVDAALAMPRTPPQLLALPAFTSRPGRRYARQWLAALDAARELPDDQLLLTGPAVDEPPPARSWRERDPAAAERLAAARTALTAIAAEHRLPVENLLAPDAVRRLSWAPPDPLDAAVVAAFLRQHGARTWQVDLTADALARGLGIPSAGPAPAAHEANETDDVGEGGGEGGPDTGAAGAA